MKGSGIMRTAFSILLAAVCSLSMAADRVVLLEDFTNHTCSPCWSYEPTLNGFVSQHIASGELACIRVHVNWPGANDPIYLANPTEQNARKSFYGINSVPSVRMDGVINVSPQGGSAALQNALSTRQAVPCHLEIFVARNGDDETGSVSIGLVAEQDLGASADMRLFATIIEEDVPGTGYWSGSYFHQAFRDNIFGPAGPVVEFQAPYPDTVYFEAEYDITEWVNDNLYLVTFVQEYSSSYKEVMNARLDKFMELETGVEGGGVESAFSVSVGPSPSGGSFTVSAAGGWSGRGAVTVHDLSGRVVGNGEVLPGGSVSLSVSEAGVYIVTVDAGSGLRSSESVVVLR